MDEDGDTPIGVRAIQALGLGFDLASDFNLKYVKRCPNGGRLVVLDEKRKRDVVVSGYGGGVRIPDVPECIRVDKGDHIRFKSDVLPFNQVIYLPSFLTNKLASLCDYTLLSSFMMNSLDLISFNFVVFSLFW